MLQGREVLYTQVVKKHAKFFSESRSFEATAEPLNLNPDESS
jgi:hypothetical protein